MSTRKKRPQKKSVSDYLTQAKAMSAFAPSLRKYSRRKTLKPAEKAAITRKANTLKFAYNLRPVSKLMAKELKDVLFAPGIQAIQFNNISPHAKIRRVKKDIYIESNGRTWVYWKLPSVYPKDMEDAGEDVFNDGMEERFDIEKIELLANRAFKEPKTETVHLWTKQGRVGEGFRTLTEFMQWVYEDYSKYQDTERWVIGIAFQIGKNRKKTVDRYKAIFAKRDRKLVTVYPKYQIDNDAEAYRWFDKVRGGYVGYVARLYKNDTLIRTA